MAKKLTFVDILNNALKVFRKDLYIVNNTYIVSGPLTDVYDTGLENNYLITLDKELKDVLNENLSDSSVYYLAKVKKDLLTTSLEEITDTIKAQEVRDHVQHNYTQCIEVKEFNHPTISNESLAELYDAGAVTTLKDVNGESRIIITKEIFPLVTASGFRNILIGYMDVGDLWKASFKYDYSGFLIMGFIHFFDV